MKRFIADAVLIIILVSIGSYVKDLDTSTTRMSMQEKVDNFEDDIAQRHSAKKQVEAKGLNEIKDNHASSLAKSTSEMVVHGIQTSVTVVSDIFDSIFQ